MNFHLVFRSVTPYPRCFFRTPCAGNVASIDCFVRELFTRSASTKLQGFDIPDEINTDSLDNIQRVKPYDPKYWKNPDLSVDTKAFIIVNKSGVIQGQWLISCLFFR